MENTLFVYNETFKVDWRINDEWLEWANRILIPKIKGSPNIQWVRLVKLLELDEEEGLTYALQAGFATKSDYNRFIEIEMTPLMQYAYGRWKDCFLRFGTLMEILNDGQ